LKVFKQQAKNVDSSYLKNKSLYERNLKNMAGAKNNDFANGLFKTGMYNTPGIDYNTNIDFNQFNNNYIYHEQFTEEINMISSLWDDLGVTEFYKIIFENLLKELDPTMKKDLLDHEMKSMKKFSDSLLVIYILKSFILKKNYNKQLL